LHLFNNKAICSPGQPPVWTLTSGPVRVRWGSYPTTGGECDLPPRRQKHCRHPNESGTPRASYTLTSVPVFVEVEQCAARKLAAALVER
jgi:hypothetical protein